MVRALALEATVKMGSRGLSLLVNERFLLSAAAVGAAFPALFTAHRCVPNGTYDRKYESCYWVRFVLGLIAGS